MLYALVRDVSPALGSCELSFVERSPIDALLAQEQHRAYAAALASLGCQLVELPAEEAYPDSVFVEDVAIVTDEVAVLTRPGAESRRGEVATVAAALAPYRPLRQIEAPGTLDGGDVLRVGRTIFVGRSGRSNIAGIEQLRTFLGDYGYVVRTLPVLDCLHLKSAVTALSGDTLLIQPQWIDRNLLAEYKVIEVDAREPHAANILRVGSGFVYPACFPHTAERLAHAGFTPTLVEVGELQKAEGAVTCCSLVFEGAPAPPLN